ncbi:hypothetical protein EU537_11865 [Candidatus Thorarchaeota archaeon]|nr:MAG: hypothetical protein EU537_11865 [Candidatus Thorarchaeota archaeon]
MAAVEIPDVVYELRERTVKHSDTYRTVPELFESISKEYLAKHNLYSRMHAPVKVILQNSADNLGPVRELLEHLDWQDRSTVMNQVTRLIKSAETLLNEENEYRSIE